MPIDISASITRLKKLPPIALVGIVGGGIAIAFYIKHNSAPKDDSNVPVQLNDVTPDNLVALTRQNVDYTATSAVSTDQSAIDRANNLATQLDVLQSANNPTAAQKTQIDTFNRQLSALDVQVLALRAKLKAKGVRYPAGTPRLTGSQFNALAPSAKISLFPTIIQGASNDLNTLKALDAQPAKPVGTVATPVAPPITTAPVPATPAPVTPTKTAPLPPPVVVNKPRVIKYPGLIDDYQLNCTLSYKGLHGTYEQVFDNQAHKAKTYPKLTGSDIEFLARNMSQIAVSGFPKGNSYGYDVMGTPMAQAYCNQLRVLNGLYPLTQEQFNAMVAQMLQLSGPLLGGDYTKDAAHGGSKQFHDVFHSGVYAKTLFNTWNYPYQCEHNAPPRRDVGAGVAGYNV